MTRTPMVALSAALLVAVVVVGGCADASADRCGQAAAHIRRCVDAPGVQEVRIAECKAELAADTINLSCAAIRSARKQTTVAKGDVAVWRWPQFASPVLVVSAASADQGSRLAAAPRR